MNQNHMNQNHMNQNHMNQNHMNQNRMNQNRMNQNRMTKPLHVTGLCLFLLATACNPTATEVKADDNPVVGQGNTAVFLLIEGTCKFMTGCVAKEEIAPTEQYLGIQKALTSMGENNDPSISVGAIDYGDDASHIHALGKDALSGTFLKKPSVYNNVITSQLTVGLANAYRRLRRARAEHKIVIIVGSGNVFSDSMGLENLFEIITPFIEANIEIHSIGVNPAHPENSDQRYRLRNLADPDRYTALDSLGDGSSLAQTIKKAIHTR